MSLLQTPKRSHDPAALGNSNWLALVALVAVQLALQVANSSYSSEFARTYDEAGHYVTGLMVRDFIKGLQWADPMGFAERYYVHYPKVAIGHWPPVFYLVQALWTLAATPSRSSLMLMMAMLTSALAFAIYRSLLRAVPSRTAFLAAVVFLLLPLVQANSSVVMTEITLALLAFCAALSFAAYLESERGRWAGLFAVFSVLAIMTKANGLALALLPLFSVLFTRRYRLLKRVSFWLPAPIVAVSCGPWYYFTLDMLQNGILADSPTWRYTKRAVPAIGLHLIQAMGPLLFVLAVVGLAAKAFSRSHEKVRDYRWVTISSLFFSAVLFHWIVPADLDPRHMVLALPALVYFFALGYDHFEARLSLPRSLQRYRKLGVAAIVLMVFALGTFRVPLREWHGFGAAAAAVVSRLDLAESVLLVSSDPTGEGSFVAEIARREQRPGHFVLRGSKVLSRSRWIGTNYKPFFRTSRALSEFLRETPIGVVVLDNSVPPPRQTLDQSLLRATLARTGDDWTLLGKYSLNRNGVEHPEAIHVYSQKGHQGKPVRKIRIDMSEMLGRHIETSADADP